MCRQIMRSRREQKKILSFSFYRCGVLCFFFTVAFLAIFLIKSTKSTEMNCRTIKSSDIMLEKSPMKRTNSKPSPRTPTTTRSPTANGGLRTSSSNTKPVFGVRKPPDTDEFKLYGKHVFTGKVANEYLKRYGETASLLKNPSWVKTHADVVAAAVLDWAVEHGAYTYCHWFQPLGSSGVRHGQSGQVYNMMMDFDRITNELKLEFSGKQLIAGETDGSSYPNGGLRATHSAGGYLAIDTSSPIFLRGDTIHIPATLVSYHGFALDEKTPLLRANDALSAHGARFLKHLGLETKGCAAMIGLEQEIFLIPRDQYYKRPDLQFTGRTIIGKEAARDQEMSDHYMAPLSTATPVLKCMKEIQDECFKMGIPLKTRHREVAPNQYEFAPMFGLNTIQIDQNLVAMQVIEEVAVKHGLQALLQEKPFNGVNGSGKHNNWSISTAEGAQLLLPKSINGATGNPLAFPIIMAALVAAVDEYGDLMRMAIASPGNDFRLGACEAPPAIISMYLGEDLTSYLEKFKEGESSEYKPFKRELDIGTSTVQPFEVPAEDRNRTSPFPYGGARFEFRAVGSSQNVSMVNTVLNTITAGKFAEFADRFDAGDDPASVAREALQNHWKIIFNGNGYDPENQQMLTDLGLWRIDSGVDAMKCISSEKNIELFDKMNVMKKEECLARETVMYNHYTGTVEMEASCMIDIIKQHVIPAVKASGVGLLEKLEGAVSTLKSALHEIEEAETPYDKACLARILRLETMMEIRKTCDDAEEEVPANLWTLATYKELLFLDCHVGPSF